MRIISGVRDRQIEFDRICFVHYRSESSMYVPIVIDSIHKDASALEFQRFFNKLSKVVCSAKHREVYRTREKSGYFQYVLSNKDYPQFPVCWFTLILDNGVEIKHDIAFGNTLIYRNGLKVFGPKSLIDRRNWTKYTELKIKKKAYKFISNQITK